MVSAVEAQLRPREAKGRKRTERMVGPPKTAKLAAVLAPFKGGYRKICDDRAKLAHIASRRVATTPYELLRFQQRMDDLRIELEEMEFQIADALYLSLDDLVEDQLDLSIDLCLERSRAKQIQLPDHPATDSEVRSILYRMYRGGSFYPLIFIRDLESAFFRGLGQRITARGMRGREIAGRTRILVLRRRFDLWESFHRRLENNDRVHFIGEIRWIWRRGRIVRRPAYAPRDHVKDARRVAAILDRAIRRRRAASATKAGKA